MKNRHGDLPLQYAVRYKRPVEVVQILGDAWERALVVKDRTDRLPLQVPVLENAPGEVVQYLVTKCPRALQERDNDGHLPLILSLRCRRPVAVVQILGDGWDQALTLKMRTSMVCFRYTMLRFIRLRQR
jgi:hypothetical protein